MNTPHVVLIGAGFGGLNAARQLRNASVQITLIDKQNYHLFQPLLYQVAIAGLLPSQIAYPLRTIFRKQKNITFHLGEVTEINLDGRYVRMNGSVIAYDYLVIAVGAETNFFGGDLGLPAHLSPDRFSQPYPCLSELGMGLYLLRESDQNDYEGIKPLSVNPPQRTGPAYMVLPVVSE